MPLRFARRGTRPIQGTHQLGLGGTRAPVCSAVSLWGHLSPLCRPSNSTGSTDAAATAVPCELGLVPTQRAGGTLGRPLGLLSHQTKDEPGCSVQWTEHPVPQSPQRRAWSQCSSASGAAACAQRGAWT